MMGTTEVWKSFENTQFAISSWGRFYNFKTKQFVKPHLHKSRSSYYWRVNLGKKKYMNHVMVAIYFLTRTDPNATQVEHDDNNTLNMNVNNLKWVTQSQNMYLRYTKGKPPRLEELK